MILQIRSIKWDYQKSVDFRHFLPKVERFCYFGFLKLFISKILQEV